jgi:methylated-DNA-[protein]-cysteine S-methyltransferase
MIGICFNSDEGHVTTMKETVSFYSKYLTRFVSVVLEDEAVQRVTLEQHARPSNTLSATPAVQALEKYLRGANRDLSVFPVNLENCSAFERDTLQCVRQIPRGSVATYSELAAKLGSPRAARAVGNALRRNPVPLFVPCHRVVGVSGLGGFSLGLDTKRKLLQLEGAQSRV